MFREIWTTTPWTLPLNNAICFSSESQYVAVSFKDSLKAPITEVYLIAEPLVSSVTEITGRALAVISHFKGKSLLGKQYKSCWHPELALPMLAADHVSMFKGTGLVHTSFAHGFIDYNIAVSDNYKVESFVDENGCYTRHMGPSLENKEVLTAGQQEVLRILKKDVVHKWKYRHSYPYDWRTNKPVIIRSSAQWFFDVSSMSKRAAQLARSIQIGNDESDLNETLCRMISSRHAWCISRQRVWGTPIPAFISKNGEAHISKQLVEHVADLIEEKGADVWWTYSVEELVTENILKSLSLQSVSDLSKGNDIMDVWMDSGVAWYCARKAFHDANTSFPTDAVVEGVDQFRGWFQSSLLTSVAVQDSIPFKKIRVHGFCVDDNNKKMSKSLGNIVDPETITDGSLRQKALGADGLRLWVALHAGESLGESKIGEKVLADIELKLVSIRNSMRFLLGGCHGYMGQCPKYIIPILDQWMLRQSQQFGMRCLENYKNYRFRTVALDALHFCQRTLSAHYISLIRDRLYCARLDSNDHLSAQFTLHSAGSTLAECLSPLLPHLSIEFFQHQPASTKKQKVLCLRSTLAAEAGPSCDLFKSGALVGVTPSTKALLMHCQMEETSFDSQLCELFGVSMVRIQDSDVDFIHPIKSDRLFCDRCRKMNRLPTENNCRRCTIALKSY